MIARLFVLALCFAGFSVAHAEDKAADYPNRTVRIVVPFPAGGPTDTFGRLVADRLQATFGKPFVVENRPGATGIIGTKEVANAAPDGYTLIFSSNSSQVMAPLLRSPAPYDLKNFRPVSMLLTFPFYLVVNNDVPARTVAEFIALAKAKPGTLNFTSPGPGSGGHLVAELFKIRAGIDAVHVPHKGVAPAQTAMMAGDVQFMFDSVGSSGPLVEAGKLRGLAVTGKDRSWAAPDKPTLLESGFPGFDAVIWLGLLAPAGMPDAIAAKLEKAVMAVARQVEIEKRIKTYAATRIGNSGAEFAAYLAKEQPVWAEVIKSNNIRLAN